MVPFMSIQAVRPRYGLVWNILQNCLNCNADAVVVVGDFNDNQLNPHCRKVKDIMRLYNLHQLINEASNFTEHSQSHIDLILTNNPSFITYTEVGPALTDLTRFHCPTCGIFNCKKHTSSSYKRNIWLYEKGNYDDYNLYTGIHLSLKTMSIRV